MQNPDYTTGLNDQQAKAVLQTEGPLLILAGAGSGKTKTLTHRIAYILAENLAEPHEILAVTFTNKAANEMRERVYELIHGVRGEAPRSFMPFMGTFHGICVRVLRTDGDHVGLDRSFVILDETDRLQLVKQICKDRGIDDKQSPPRTIAHIISSNKNELVSPEEFASIASSPVQQHASTVYLIYEAELRKMQAVDFDDLIGLTVELLEKHPDIRARWQKQFKYILIDEYQDTNSAQYRLVKLLVDDKQNICVVGDDWQSIYSWRGADFRNILNFEKDYPKATIVKLEQNYRSTKHILDAADAVITKNDSRSTKKLWTDEGQGSKVRVLQAQNERNEAESIIRSVQSEVNLKVRDYKDYAVLYRTNAQSRSIEEQFVRYGIPYRIYGGVRFYDRKEIKDILAYLRCVYQPEDRVSFERIVNVPARGLGTKSLENFFGWMVLNQKSLTEALRDVEQNDTLTARARKSLGGLGQALVNVRSLAEDQSVAGIIDMILRQTDYLAYVNDGTLQGQSREENVKELLSVAESYSDLDLGGFLEEVALVSSNDNADGEPNSVTLMTLHAAKGLEFPSVFMVGLEETVLPHSRALYDSSEMEEERRLCYVGMTRAMESLTMSYASSRMLYGTVMHNPPSRFLSDIDPKDLDQTGSGLSSQTGNTDLSFGDNPWDVKTKDSGQPEYVVELEEGDFVKHSVFGRGRVVEIEGDTAAVYFESKGVKKLNTSFAPLEKLDDN